MEGFGWLLFVGGVFLMVGSAFFGIDAGGIRVMNLAGTVTGAAAMISGAIFVAADRIINTLQKGQIYGQPTSPTYRENTDTSAVNLKEIRDDPALPKAFFVILSVVVGMVIIAMIVDL